MLVLEDLVCHLINIFMFIAVLIAVNVWRSVSLLIIGLSILSIPCHLASILYGNRTFFSVQFRGQEIVEPSLSLSLKHIVVGKKVRCYV